MYPQIQCVPIATDFSERSLHAAVAVRHEAAAGTSRDLRPSVA